ncbi:hypothetical protein [Streptomyces somaliensis]|uniref:hypothetical protein n=1 Tax=Streptomyces somaliensis TaxID=78355 RepID=UPI0034E939EC|nr:hypothetical protein [Streptomyces somaliensis]
MSAIPTRVSAALAVACAVVVGAAVPSSAINSYNAAPAPERTEVGALVATWDDDGDAATPDRVDWVCSGTMVDADTFLTAAHCTTDWPENARFFVSLDQDVQGALDEAAAATPATRRPSPATSPSRAPCTTTRATPAPPPTRTTSRWSNCPPRRSPPAGRSPRRRCPGRARSTPWARGAWRTRRSPSSGTARRSRSAGRAATPTRAAACG